MYEPYISKDKRLHLFCLCDSTLFFLIELVDELLKFECTDIQTSGRVVSEGVPAEKPWCNYLYEASGVLPDKWYERALEVRGE